jgi:hypothetical protein
MPKAEPDWHAAAREMRRKGVSAISIAKQLGKSRSAVTRAVACVVEKTADPCTWVEEATLLRNKTPMSLKAIAQRLGIDKGRIFAALKDVPPPVNLYAQPKPWLRKEEKKKKVYTYRKRDRRYVRPVLSVHDQRRRQARRALMIDAIRTKPSITLPKLTILEDV